MAKRTLQLAHDRYGHGIRILPGPSSLWFDAFGRRLPVPCLPGFDTLATLAHIMSTGRAYSWFVLDQRIIEKEVALSGSEQNPDLTDRSMRQLFRRIGRGAPPPVEAFMAVRLRALWPDRP